MYGTAQNSGQRLDIVNQIHLVLTGGKLVQQKASHLLQFTLWDTVLRQTSDRSNRDWTYQASSEI